MKDETHGFSTLAPQESSPELIKDSLLAMDNELQKLPSGIQTRAYRKMLQNGSQYIRGKAFRLKFLRAEKFDAKKAARRFYKWLNVLQSSFGDAALHRPLYMKDLGIQETKIPRIGSAQFLAS